ncbi:MAG: SpoIIE family protein phosphatase [Magnetococcales bacterium]|nr:SpoIIE family protein phosphatase [Magnetococcales bacterium]
MISSNKNSLIYRFRNTLIGVVAIILVVFTAAMIHFDRVRLEEQLRERLVSLGKLAEASLSSAMWNIEEESIREFAKAIFTDKVVVRTVIGDSEEVFATLKSPELFGLPDRELANPDRFLTKTVNITHYGERVGYMVITLSRDDIKTQMTNNIMGFLALSALVILAISVTTITVTRRHIFHPLNKLKKSAVILASGELDVEIVHEKEDEIGILAKSFESMRVSLKTLFAVLAEANEKLEEHNRNLEEKVRERTQELDANNKVLHKTLLDVEAANQQITESIEYARMIQNSLLPNLENVQILLPDSFFMWEPRDIVGGDIYFFDIHEEGFIVALMDCTGHGVPGAFMTMIVNSGLRRIVKDEGRHDPGEILKALNYVVKTSLQQHTRHARSDDGLDAGVIAVNVKDRTITYAGAKLSMFLVREGAQEVSVIKGNRQSLGYRKSDLNYQYENKVIPVDGQLSCYLTSDGYIDQTGGAKGFSFGNRRLKKLLLEHGDRHMSEQKKILMEAFEAYRGGEVRLDDLSMIGFTLSPDRIDGMKGRLLIDE